MFLRRKFWTVACAFIIVLLALPSDGQVSDTCMRCICVASTNCNLDTGCEPSGFCGPYRMSIEYWMDAGKPGDGFRSCANNVECAQESLMRYVARYRRDCNGDGVVDCDDFVKIHRFGPTGCNTTYDVDNYLRRYGTCRFQSLFTGWSSIAVRPLASGALAPPQSFLPSYKSFSTIRYSRTTTTTRPTTRWTTRPTVRTTTPRPTTWPTRTTTVRPTTRTTTTRSTTTRPTTRTTTTRPTTRTTTRTTTRAITTKSMTRIAVANIVNERKYVIEYLPRIQVNSSVTKTRITSSSRGWNNGTNGLVAWSSNCDFHDHICLGVKQSLPEQCGGFCAADPNCKLFVAHSCLCLMLTPNNSRSAITSKQGTICGYVKSRYSP